MRRRPLPMPQPVYVRSLRGLGQVPALPDVSQLPAVGDLQGQLTHGQNLITTAQSALAGFQSGNPDTSAIASLLSQGMTMASANPGTGVVGTVVRDIMTIGAATAAGAVGGPWGAAAGAIISTLEVLIQSLFGGGPGGNVSYNGGQGEPTQGAMRLYNLVKQWGQMTLHLGPTSGNVMGWSFYDYLAHKYPPATARGQDQTSMWSYVTQNINAATKQGHTPTNSTALSFPGPNAGSQTPEQKALQYFTDNYIQYGPCSASQDQPFDAGCYHFDLSATNYASEYIKVVQPIATPVLWLWAEPGNINDVENNEFFGRSKLNDKDRYNLWSEDTIPILGANGQQISIQQILAYAEANRPPSWFFAADLYVLQTSGRNQIFCNCETMSGLATACGILASGGSLQSVAAELIVQQSVLYALDKSVSPLFRALVEVYLARATAERAAAGSPSVPVATPWSPAAIVAVSVLAAAVGGILAYSAYSGQSPVTVVQTMGSRAKSRIQGR